MTPKPATPSGLAAEGKRFFRAVVGGYTLRVDELALLEHASRTLDLLVRLDAEMINAPLTVKGSMGQMREHPLLAEARQQRQTFSRLIAHLKLPDVGAGTGHAGAELAAAGQRRTAAARAAANARWAR